MSKSDDSNDPSAEIPTTVLWRDEPAKHDYPAAANYLSLIADKSTVADLVDSLQKAPVEHYRANDLAACGSSGIAAAG